MKKMLSLFLSLLMVFTSLTFVSCGGNNEETKATVTGGSVNEDIPEEYRPELSPTNWEGKEFNWLVNTGFWGDQMDFESESEDPVNTAIYLRNRTVESKYNIKINQITHATPEQAVQTAYSANDNLYHAVSMC